MAKWYKSSVAVQVAHFEIVPAQGHGRVPDPVSPVRLPAIPAGPGLDTVINSPVGSGLGAEQVR